MRASLRNFDALSAVALVLAQPKNRAATTPVNVTLFKFTNAPGAVRVRSAQAVLQTPTRSSGGHSFFAKRSWNGRRDVVKRGRQRAASISGGSG
jgi:hypothetical protein